MEGRREGGTQNKQFKHILHRLLCLSDWFLSAGRVASGSICCIDHAGHITPRARQVNLERFNTVSVAQVPSFVYPEMVHLTISCNRITL